MKADFLIMDQLGDTPEEDHCRTTLTIIPDDQSREEYEGITQAVIYALIFKHLMDNPDLFSQVMGMIDMDKLVEECKQDYTTEDGKTLQS